MPSSDWVHDRYDDEPQSKSSIPMTLHALTFIVPRGGGARTRGRRDDPYDRDDRRDDRDSGRDRYGKSLPLTGNEF